SERLRASPQQVQKLQNDINTLRATVCSMLKEVASLRRKGDQKAAADKVRQIQVLSRNGVDWVMEEGGDTSSSTATAAASETLLRRRAALCRRLRRRFCDGGAVLRTWLDRTAASDVERSWTWRREMAQHLATTSLVSSILCARGAHAPHRLVLDTRTGEVRTLSVGACSDGDTGLRAAYTQGELKTPAILSLALRRLSGRCDNALESYAAYLGLTSAQLRAALSNQPSAREVLAALGRAVPLGKLEAAVQSELPSHWLCLEQVEAAPWRLTPAMRTLLGPFLTSGVFSGVLVAGAQAFWHCPELHSVFSLFARDDLSDWLASRTPCDRRGF
ncbi:MAG: hypothetical protein MHM6MM_009165, partial [Cercozoa sp. M6MM]